MPKSADLLTISPEQRRTLEAWVRAQNTPQSVAFRARIALLAADGVPNSRIAREVGVSRPTVMLWRQRFLQGGPSALTEIAPGRGRRVTYGADRVNEVVQATTQTKPPGATHWSTRTMAKAQGLSKATVQRIWSAHGLQPHRTKRFKLSKDRRFTEKLTDVVGLYLNPPDKAVVLCVDEKSQIQALQRTQPGLPMKKGRCGTMTHDYKRHGTTTLFAALNVLDGRVIGECMAKHRHQEFLRFLRRLDREFSKETPLHLIVDNYGTHNQSKVKAWLEKHPRFTLHFTPTSSSWLNLVERWFRELTEKRVRRGSFESVPELIAAIKEYLAASNADPKPFVWHASAQAILTKLSHCNAIYETLDYNLLFRWFLGMNLVEPSFDATTFTKNRERLLKHRVGQALFDEVVLEADRKGLLSDEHFTVDGTLIEAAASLKSFKPRDGDPPKTTDDDPGNPSVDFHGERRSNATHQSTTDPEARLLRKGKGKEAKLVFMAHALMENRHGMLVDFQTTQATGTAERDTVPVLVDQAKERGFHPKTLGGDKGYDTGDCVAALRRCGVTPHVAQNTNGRSSAIDGRTTRHPGYAISQRIRKRVEEIFGWMKTVGGFRRTRYKGLDRTGLAGYLVATAYNLVRMAKLLAPAQEASAVQVA